MGTAKRPRLGGLKLDLARSLGIPIFSIEDGLRVMAGYEDEKESMERRKR
jgi:hypothetical protein